MELMKNYLVVSFILLLRESVTASCFLVRILADRKTHACTNISRESTSPSEKKKKLLILVEAKGAVVYEHC